MNIHPIKRPATPHTPIEILLVDDNISDVVLAQEAFLEAKVPNRLSVVHDGVEALAFLRREGSFGLAPRPDIILLDINMPRMNGFEFLRELKADHELRGIPVVMLTTSRAAEDVTRSYQSYASAFVSKPVDFGEFVRVVKTFEDFWMGVAQLPSTSRPEGA